jgi:DNA repair protein RecN (Recombination protein N)
VLIELSVRNFAIVEDKTLYFKRGLAAFTGETGAGKSLLLNAITLLLGSKNQKDVVREGSESAVVEGVFNLSRHADKRRLLDELGFSCDEDHLLVIKREISREGSTRNRIWIQGSLATRTQLQEILGDWIEVSGQHEFLRLNRESYVLDVLDDFGDLVELRSDYEEKLLLLKEAEKRWQELEAKSSDRLHLMDLRRYQIEEFAKAEISEETAGQEEEWARDRQRMASVEKILTAVDKALSLIRSDASDAPAMVQALQAASQELRPFEQMDGDLARILEQLDQVRSVLMDAQADLESYSGRLELDPAKLNEVESKLSVLNRLKRKYAADTHGLMQKLAEAKEELRVLEKFETELEDLKREHGKVQASLRTLASDLHKRRCAAAVKMSKVWERNIRELGIPQTSFALVLRETEDFGAHGTSRIEAQFSANPGQPLRPLQKIASGGELSRILLALKQIISGRSEVCAYLFDEIDTGLGGETAHRVAATLRKISEQSQVIVVTHLAQIAAYASEHFSIAKRSNKSKTVTQIEFLDEAARTQEIARMLGASQSKAALALAQDLLKKGQKGEIPKNASL